MVTYQKIKQGELTNPTVSGSVNNKNYSGEAVTITVDTSVTTELVLVATVKYYSDEEHTQEIVGLPEKVGKYYVTIEFSSKDPDYGTNYAALPMQTKQINIT